MIKETTLTTPQILETFAKHTTLKARAILLDSVKKSLTVGGSVLDVCETFPNVFKVTMLPSDNPDLKPFEIFAEFSAGASSEIANKLAEVAKGQKITVRGLVQNITPHTLSLNECSIIEG